MDDDNVSTDIEIVIGGAGADTLGGSEANDTLIGGSGDDAIDGNGGDDMLIGGFGGDDLDGGTGNDTLQAGAGDDSLSGEDGSDRLLGETGTDSFDGGDDADAIVSRDGTREDVSCGDGVDSADADAFDNLDDDCEKQSGFVAGAAISISARSLKMTRDGLVTIHVVCVRTPKDCDGHLTVTAPDNKRLRKKTLGGEDFSVSSGDSDDVEITLSKAARRAVISGKRLPVRVRSTVANTPDVSQTVTIKAPKAEEEGQEAFGQDDADRRLRPDLVPSPTSKPTPETAGSPVQKTGPGGTGN